MNKYVYIAITSVRTSRGIITKFLIIISLHRGATLSSFLFSLVMGKLIRLIQEEVSWYMLFIDNIILVDETRCGVNFELKTGKDSLGLMALDYVGLKQSI